MRVQRLLLPLLLLLMSSIVLHAQDVVEPQEVDTNFVLFTLEQVDIHGAGPQDWDQIQPGMFLRSAIENDPTYLLHIVETDETLESAVRPLLEALQVDNLPAAEASYETAALNWSIHSVEFDATSQGAGMLKVDFAIAQTEQAIYIVVLQSLPDELAMLRDAVLLPALDVFGLPIDSIQQALGLPALKMVTLDLFDVETVVPATWQAVNTGAYARTDLRVDGTTLLIQTSPDLSPLAFGNLLVQQLGLASGLPEATASYATELFEWRLHRVEIDSGGQLSVLQLALAQDADRTYMVALLSSVDESAMLLESVVQPALDAMQPLTD